MLAIHSIWVMPAEITAAVPGVGACLDLVCFGELGSLGGTDRFRRLMVLLNLLKDIYINYLLMDTAAAREAAERLSFCHAWAAHTATTFHVRPLHTQQCSAGHRRTPHARLTPSEAQTQDEGAQGRTGNSHAYTHASFNYTCS